ncbi:MAG: serine hydrolase [Opitutaceae bacterium]
MPTSTIFFQFPPSLSPAALVQQARAPSRPAVHLILRLALAFLLTSVISAFAQDPARMDAAVNVHAASGRFMGSVLVAKDGVVVFEKSSGSANLEWDVPNAPDTKFRIGSLTKQFTAAAILLLEERGKLKVEDPITPLIPSAPVSWNAVTIHQLLNHTSGIPDFSNLPEQRVRQRSPTTPEQIMRTFRDLPLEFEPGEKFKYSNSGYILLAFIIERVSGQSYEAFLRENIFVPLAMKDSGYDSNTTLLPKRAAGYLSGPGGLAHAPYVDMHHPYGAGGLYSTTQDLLRWTTALFGGRVLSATALQKVITPGRNDNAYGLVVGAVQGRKLIRHGGMIEGFSSHLSYDPESKLTVIVLANVYGASAAELSNQLGAIARGEKVTLPSDRQAVEVPAATLRRYVGVYQLTPQITNTVRLAAGQLTTQLSGQPALPLFPESDRKFFLNVVDAQVEFVTDDQGRVNSLIQRQGGRTLQAPRVSDTVVERTAIALPPAILASYVGRYELKPGIDLDITLEGDRLMSQLTGQAKVASFPETETRFFLKVVDAQLEFFKDAQGAVSHVMLRQGAENIKGSRQP